jgi:hypothetical protein
LTCYDNDGGDCDGRLNAGGPKVEQLPNRLFALIDEEDNMSRERDLTGYNVYRSETAGSGYSLLDQTDASTVTYNDDSVNNGTTYYYVVTSLFDGDNESDASNEASATPMETVTISLGDAEVMSGEEVTVSVALDNPKSIGGVQVDFVDTPDNLTILSAVGTERVPADWSLSVAEQADGSGRLLGFSFQGTVIEAGSGDVFVITFTASASEPTTVTLCTSGETFSDPLGAGYLSEGDCSGVDIDVEGINITLSGDVGPLDQGDSGSLTISMENPYPVYGVEIHLSDTPEAISAVDVVAESGVAGLDGTLSFSEVNGEVIILWFSLTGQYIDVGSAPLFTIEYAVNTNAPNETTVFVFEFPIH